MNWDASKQELFYWHNQCPKGWTPHWYESDAGHVTIHIIRDAKPVEEKTEEEQLNIARGRSYLNDR
tara:strand:+ start:4386 stop:4583 length:198 start_codon:yes stop_codon:yes gene_type:complete